jgi:hypothetical protein
MLIISLMVQATSNTRAAYEENEKGPSKYRLLVLQKCGHHDASIRTIHHALDLENGHTPSHALFDAI